MYRGSQQRAGAPALGAAVDRLRAGAVERALHPDSIGLPIHFPPLRAAQFAFPRTDIEGQGVQRRTLATFRAGGHWKP